MLVTSDTLLPCRRAAYLTDTFDKAWRKVLARLNNMTRREGIGFDAEMVEELEALTDGLPEETGPDHIVRLLEDMPSRLVVIFDEFDRVPDDERVVFTDLMKSMADHGLRSTIILVGVADTVEQLVRGHASIERALVQVPIPRMTEDELMEIIDNASRELEFGFDDAAKTRIVTLSQGLPHYTHLLGSHAVRQAVDRFSRHVTLDDVEAGAAQAVDNAQETITALYHRATQSARSEALYEHVLAACALAPKDEMSFFRPAKVADPISAIRGRPYEIPAFAAHLTAFCDLDRGPVLERRGRERRYRYRFTNPLMEPFVIMRGLRTGLITGAMLDRYSGRRSDAS